MMRTLGELECATEDETRYRVIGLVCVCVSQVCVY